MDKIQLLPDSVANQIAAGEVIQRPASVIKELVENAVDAGARKIDIIIVDGGRTSIQVIDDGIGMSITDARLSFERHATSKIRKAEDLFSLHTMGFRGEALPSIAAVAQVTLKTRQADAPVGTCLCIAGSRVTSQEPVSCPVGSNFLIENLFFNVPVRRRFLKSNATELTNILAAFQRIALVYPEISFTLQNNGQKMYDLRATNMLQRIVDIFDKKINQNLVPMDVETTLCNIKGFVGKPESAKKKGAHQYFFVNGRYMKHPYFQKAVMEAYDRLIPQGEQVPFFIYFTMKPEDIDVNIHPTKTEIKFQEERAVRDILIAAVKEAVGKISLFTKLDFDTEGKPDFGIFGKNQDVRKPDIGIDHNYDPFNNNNGEGSDNKLNGGGSGSEILESALNDDTVSVAPKSWKKGNSVPNEWETLYESLTDTGSNDTKEAEQQLSFMDEDIMDEQSAVSANLTDRSHHHMQYKGSYIITTVQAGIMVTDQERAHERILYERYMKQMESTKHTSQKILFPETVQFTLDEMIVLPSILPEMEALGFDMSNLGSGTYSINGVPTGLEGIDIVNLVQEMVSSAAERTTTIRKEIFSSLAESMAHKAAIPHGQFLSDEEMENIITELLQCDDYNYTPKGKRTTKIIGHSQISF